MLEAETCNLGKLLLLGILMNCNHGLASIANILNCYLL